LFTFFCFQWFSIRNGVGMTVAVSRAYMSRFRRATVVV
jgi:hypothetical protein